MRLFLDITTRKLVYGPGNNLPLSENVALTRGDRPTLDISFMDAGVIVDPAIDSVFFCLKSIDADTVLALATSFVKSGTGATAMWSGEINLNTVELNGALGLSGTEIVSLNVKGELGYIVGGRVTTGRMLTVLVENDLYRDGETAPIGALVEYPTAPTANAVLAGNATGDAWAFLPVRTTSTANAIPRAGGDGKIDLNFLPDIGSGAIFRFGTTAPDDGVGADDDCYIRTTTGQLYQRVAEAYVLRYTFPTGGSGGGMVGVPWRFGSVDPTVTEPDGSAEGDLFLYEPAGSNQVFQRGASAYAEVGRLMRAETRSVYLGSGLNSESSIPSSCIAFDTANHIWWGGSSGSLSEILVMGEYARRVAVPSTVSDAGNQGQYAVDNSFLYLCTAANTWRRTALSTW